MCAEKNHTCTYLTNFKVLDFILDKHQITNLSFHYFNSLESSHRALE